MIKSQPTAQVIKPEGGEPDLDESSVPMELSAEELRNGADFAEMVRLHSGDPASKGKGGRFDMWLKVRESGVSPPYTDALYRIEKVGEYSEIAETQAGFHIVRLDELEELTYLPYEEVKDKITSTLEAEFRLLSVKDFNKSFQISDDAFIDVEVRP